MSCVLRATKLLVQAKLDASHAHDAHLRREQPIPPSNVSSPSSASTLTIDSDCNPASPVPDNFLLSSPLSADNLNRANVLTSAIRSGAVDSWTTAPDSTRTSPDSASSSSSNGAPPRVRMQWSHHALLVSAKGTRIKVSSSQRQHCLYEAHCVRDRSRFVDHRLIDKLPSACFPVLDELAALDSPPMSSSCG